MTAKSDTGASDRIDPDDAPELTEAFFETAVYRENGMIMPRPVKRGRPPSARPKARTGLRLDADVLDHFRAQGPGWQTPINATLHAAMERER